MGRVGERDRDVLNTLTGARSTCPARGCVRRGARGGVLAVALTLAGAAHAQAEATLPAPAPTSAAVTPLPPPPPPAPVTAPHAATAVTSATAVTPAMTPEAAPAEGRAVAFHAAMMPNECASCVVTPAVPDVETERERSRLERELDGIVVDSLQDLGLTVVPTDRDDAPSLAPTDSELTQRAQTSWVFSPRVDVVRNQVTIRMVAVAPGSTVLLVRTEKMRPDELEVRTVLMMRDLVRAGSRKTFSPVSTPRADEDAVVHAARSPGRAVLALNAAVLGGYIGLSLQRAGGSDDARLTYPLIALGAGIGLGGSMIVADEWDVGTGDAWFLSAATWWPAIGALLIAKDEPDRKRYLYGSAAAAGGLALGTVSLALGPMSEGDALVAHSGGLFGLMLGGVADLAVRGRTDFTPTTGMGVGTISGVLITGALARLAPEQPPSRILLIDLSAGLGALTGAAVGSPLVFGDNVGPTRNRLWLSTIALGTFVGAGIGFFTTRSESHPHEAHLPWAPYVGVVGESLKRDGTTAPIPGAGLHGTW